MIIQGIWTSFAKKPYIFMIFQWGGGIRTSYPPLWIRACSQSIKVTMLTRWCYNCQLQICNCIVGSTGGGGGAGPGNNKWLYVPLGILVLIHANGTLVANCFSRKVCDQPRGFHLHELHPNDRILLETVLHSCSNF